jgi:hypothetical protein
MLTAGLNNQLFIYMAEVYPNTELGSKEYQEKFKIKTTKIKLNEIHCSPRKKGWVREYQNIVTETYSMTIDDWKAMSKFSLVTMLMHSMKAGIYILAYLNKRHGIEYSKIIDKIISTNTTFISSIMNFFEEYSNGLLNGEGRGIVINEYSDVYLEPEEVALIKISNNKKEFFNEMYIALSPLVAERNLFEFEEVLKFQIYLIPEFKKEDSRSD